MLILLEHGYRVTMIDNLSNSYMRVLDHMTELAGANVERMEFIKARAVFWGLRPGFVGAAARGFVGAGRRGSCCTAAAHGTPPPPPPHPAPPALLPARPRAPQMDVRDKPALDKLFADSKWVAAPRRPGARGCGCRRPALVAGGLLRRQRRLVR